MLKITFLPRPLVFDLEFEGHAVGVCDEISRQKTRMLGMPYGEEISIVGRKLEPIGTMWPMA